MERLDLDPTELEQSLLRMVVVRLRLYAGFAAVWGVLQLGLFRLMYPSLGASPYLVDVAFTACAAAGYAASTRVYWSSNGITGIGVVLGLVQLALHAVTVEQTGEDIYFYIAAIVLVGAGSLVLHSAWLAIFVAAGATITLVFGRPPDHHVAGDALLITSAGVTSALIHLVGRHYVLDIELLRQRDHAQKLALEKGLAETRRQLAEREASEEARKKLEAERAAVETERAMLAEQLIQAQKMESLGTLAGGFAHDMNNVLGGILAGAEMLREEAPDKFRPDIDDLITATQRGAELTRNLLGFARRGQYRKETIDLRAVVGGMIRMLQRTVPKGVTFESTFEEPCPWVEGDPSLLTQALVNLCLNSVDSMRGVGRLTIAVRSIDLPIAGTSSHDIVPGTYAAIVVTDTGSGMDAETRRRMFEPFFTTKEIGRGTGLGLAMVYGTVKSWKGSIDVQSDIGAGTTIALYLPTVAPSETAKPATRTSAVDPTMKGMILVVDDDPRIRKIARRILESRGYVVQEAGDGAEALVVFDKHHGKFDLVILDMAMPVMGGAECFRKLRTLAPDLRVLLASGYALEEDARRCLSEGAVGFVDKPYTVEGFATAVGRAVRGEPVAATLD